MNPKLEFSAPAKFLALTVLVTALAGCNRDQAKVYTVPKENANPMTAGTLPPGHPETGNGMGMNSGMNLAMDPSARPKLTYTKPEGWTEADLGSMRVASFKITKDGKQADVSVIPLGGFAGGEVANVNRWRGQVGLEPLADDALKKTAEPVEIAGQPGDLYDVAGKNPGSGEPMRVLGAIQNRNDMAWFFKISGDADLVEAEKPALIAFLKSVKFEAPDMAALPPSHPPIGGMGMPGMATANTPISHEGQPAWQVPAGWTETGGGSFLIAKFLISGDANAQAAVNVSSSAGDGGGFAANVNRWRKQLGLPDQTESEISQGAKSIEVSNGKANVVEMNGTNPQTGQPAQLVGVVVPQGGQTWFYKLMGDAKLVATQKDAFLKFVQSAKY